jgi:transposase
LAQENGDLHRALRERDAEIDRLKAENKLLHQRGFKAGRAVKKAAPGDDADVERNGNEVALKRRGAPPGHKPWVRKVPDRVDRIVSVAAPLQCPHCESPTDPARGDRSVHLQEDIELRPVTVVTRFEHDTAWCPCCRRQVAQAAEGGIAFAPIGPKAKAAALYLRHEMKLPYRKVKEAMEKLFGLSFVPASCLGFEKRARRSANPLHEGLMEKMRHSDLVHADEPERSGDRLPEAARRASAASQTFWREDGRNVILWYAGNDEVAVFRMDPNRSAEAAKRLLGERLDALLVTDAYASYNAIEVKARQSCLAHLLRTAREIAQTLATMEASDPPAGRFLVQLQRLLRRACALEIPKLNADRIELEARLLGILDRICSHPLEFAKAETLRKRLLPGAREHGEAFAFVRLGGPPTNNHAERALRPLVIFRKVCLGTRSATGSENLAIFASVVETARLRGCETLEIFEALLTDPPETAHEILFPEAARAG